MHKITLEANNLQLPEIEEDKDGFYFMIDELRAAVPPGFSGKNLLESVVVTFFIGNLVGLGVNMLSSYLYDLLKNRNVKTVKVNGIELSGKKEEIDAFLNELAKETKEP